MSDENTTELEPCPFCGSDEIGIEDEVEICGGCCSTFESFFHPAGQAEAATIEKWNKRI